MPVFQQLKAVNKLPLMTEDEVIDGHFPTPGARFLFSVAYPGRRTGPMKKAPVKGLWKIISNVVPLRK